MKSLALTNPESVRLGARGIEEDRRFLVCDHNGAMVTQRQIGKLAQVGAQYCAHSDTLRLAFPDDTAVSASPELGRRINTKVFRRTVTGSIVTGELSDALSDFCGANLALLKTDNPGECFDAYPLSLLSQASIDLLGEHQGNLAQAGASPAIPEYRRFRPNFLLDGCDPHEEDSWLGKNLVVGDGEARLRVEALDPRCAITTLNPDSGERDLDIPRIILRYRLDVSRSGACFGVYAAVVTPGIVSIGDKLRLAK